MNNIFLYEDFREFLKDELRRRNLRNSKYSLRAFARDIGISFSRLSEMLSSETGISSASGQRIADRLKMSFLEREYFLDLIAARYGRSALIRKQAKQRMRQHKTKKIFVHIQKNSTDLLHKWYYIPLVELLGLKRELKISAISKILGISEEEVVASSLFLAEKGFLERNKRGIWRKASHFQKVESSTPVTVIRQFHRDILKRASVALEVQAIERRKYLSSYFTVRKEDVAEARQDLEKFNQNFLKKYGGKKNADTVYVLAMQLFGTEEK